MQRLKALQVATSVTVTTGSKPTTPRPPTLTETAQIDGVQTVLFQMLPTALVPSWKVGVVRMDLHTQQSCCFGNLPGERGIVITWCTPTLFTPPSIGSYWMGSRG